MSERNKSTVKQDAQASALLNSALHSLQTFLLTCDAEKGAQMRVAGSVWTFWLDPLLGDSRDKANFRI